MKILKTRFGEDMKNELSGEAINHREVVPQGNLYVSYFLDITEIEIED